MDYKTFINRAANHGFRFDVRFDDGEWISDENHRVTDPQEVIDHVKSVSADPVVRLWSDEGEWVGTYLVTEWMDNPEESIIDYNSSSVWVDKNELIAQFA